MKPAAQSNWHTIMDARNRELHRAIAEKMRQNPTLVLRVQKTLERWLRAVNESERGYDALLEWKRILEEQPLDRVLEFISSGDEEACRLRQSSPFVGLLSDQERMAIFSKYEVLRG